MRSQRLFLRAPLAEGVRVALDRAQSNYLVNVLRLRAGAEVRVFNGRGGEWQANLVEEGRRSFRLDVVELVRPQMPPADLDFLFVPVKQARLDYMVEKAVEMGVGRLRPVLSQHSQVTRVNNDRMEAHAIEAAEQCGVLSVPDISALQPLANVIDSWPEDDQGRRLVFCDEGHEVADPVSILSSLGPSPLAVLVGPEGGFSEGERQLLRAQSFVTPVPLGPRILRADTAAVAALALVQAVLGDWRPLSSWKA
jgi:16S rRNA (uracil1498-N3)-methyltransferase